MAELNEEIDAREKEDQLKKFEVNFKTTKKNMKNVQIGPKTGFKCVLKRLLRHILFRNNTNDDENRENDEKVDDEKKKEGDETKSDDGSSDSSESSERPRYNCTRPDNVRQNYFRVSN